MCRRGIGAAILLTLSMLAFPSLPVRAHLDDEGPPRLVTSAKLLDVTLLSDFGDGVAPHYAELMLTVDGVHDTHGPVAPSVHRNDKYRFAADPLQTWDIDDVVYAHEECSPRDRITVTARLLEQDYDENDAAKAAAISAANLLRLAFTASNPYMIVLSVGSSVVNVAIKGLNGHDLVGTATGDVPANGVVTLETTDAEQQHHAEIRLKGVTKELEDPGGCAGGPIPVRRLKVSRAGRQLYEPLARALSRADGITSLDPTEVDDAGVAAIRAAVKSLAVGLGESYAGAMITDALQDDGIETAIQRFTDGQQLEQAGEDAAAIESFRRAWTAAAKAHADPAPGGGGRLPLSVVPTSGVLATSSGNETGLLATVLGSSGDAELAVNGLPRGVTSAVTKLSEGTDIFRIDWQLDGVRTGTYRPELVATTPQGTVATPVTLLVR